MQGSIFYNSFLGINIGDEILTDAILTAVDECGGNESVIVQPLDISPTELAVTGKVITLSAIASFFWWNEVITSMNFK